MGEDITCWACQGLAAVMAGCSSSTGRAAPEALPQGGAGMRTVSPYPINCCWAARSCEKGKWKSRSSFHPCCCCYINKSREQRLSPLNPSLTDSDWKPLPGWLFSDKAWGEEVEQCDTGSREVDVSIAKETDSHLLTAKEWVMSMLQEFWAPHIHGPHSTVLRTAHLG